MFSVSVSCSKCTCSFLEACLSRFRGPVDLLAPSFTDKLEPILAGIQERGNSTAENILLAREVLDAAQRFFFENASDAGYKGFALSPEMLRTLQWILRNGGSSQESVDIARAAELMVDATVSEMDPRFLENHISIHDAMGSKVWQERVKNLSEQERLEALQASAKMEAQMQGLLQSFLLNRSAPMRNGRLNTNTLYKLFTGKSDIFFKKVDRRRVNTEIVLCIDMSGSMRFENKALLASKALFSLAHSLARIRGITFSIIGFFDNHVVDILKSGHFVTPRMNIVPDGGTLCGSALKFAMQTFSASSDPRKIVIMLTDGDANDAENFEDVIARARKSGVEFLGVGIQNTFILQYLPEEECCIIADLGELAPEILRMLRKKMGIEH